MKELLGYKFVSPKSTAVVLSWPLKRTTFIVDMHVHRLAGLWRWRPQEAGRERTQQHLEARVPERLKFELIFLWWRMGGYVRLVGVGEKGGRVRC
jgi:endonuclease III